MSTPRSQEQQGSVPGPETNLHTSCAEDNQWDWICNEREVKTPEMPAHYSGMISIAEEMHG